MMVVGLVQEWRRRKSGAYHLETNSSARRIVAFPLWGRTVTAYANANLSIVSGKECDANCPFCVEKLRPASRGRAHARPQPLTPERYLAALDSALEGLAPLNPSVSITGGEPSLDPELPAILGALVRRGARKVTITTNGSGLFTVRRGKRILDWITQSQVRHLNISRACADDASNRAIMRLRDGLDVDSLREVVAIAKAHGPRPRLSCALMDGGVHSIDGVIDYLRFAEELGVDNVVFRELMTPDAESMDQRDPVARFCLERKTPLAPILDQVSQNGEFTFLRQVMGYYYYVEVWRWRGMDVVFESADLQRIETMKRLRPGLIHEFVFHPDGTLASTWQAWDGALG